MFPDEQDLSPEQTSHLLTWIVCRQLREYMNRDRLDDFQQDLAMEVRRMPGVTDEQMLPLSRAVVARAFRLIAHGIVHGLPGSLDEEDRYWNAICREALPESGRNQHATLSG